MTNDKAIDQMRGWESPPALDLLTAFRKKFVTIAERRARELSDVLYARRDEGPSAELRDVIDEYESLRYFEQELNRVIRAFMDEATKPWRDAYADSMARALPPAFTSHFDPADSELDRMRKMEGMCRSDGTAFGAAIADIISDQISKERGPRSAAGKDGL